MSWYKIDQRKNKDRRADKTYTQAELDEAVKAENRVCAKLLEDKSARAWDIFKRSDDHTKRGNKYYEGISDGMDEISEEIKARSLPDDIK